MIIIIADLCEHILLLFICHVPARWWMDGWMGFIYNDWRRMLYGIHLFDIFLLLMNCDHFGMIETCSITILYQHTK